MRLAPFVLEDWLAKYRDSVPHHLGMSTGPKWTLAELRALMTDTERAAFDGTVLGYCPTEGREPLRAALASMYGAHPDEILIFNGGAEALLALFFVAGELGTERRRPDSFVRAFHGGSDGARRRGTTIRAAPRERFRARRRRDRPARRRAHEADPGQHAAQPERRRRFGGRYPSARRSRAAAGHSARRRRGLSPDLSRPAGAVGRRILARDGAGRLLEVLQLAGGAHRLAARAGPEAAPRARERAQLLHDLDGHARRAAGRGCRAQSRDDLGPRAQRQRAESRRRSTSGARRTRNRSSGCGRADQ